MDANTFIFGVAVGVVASVVSGVVLAVIFGTWRGVWRYLGSIVNDIRLTMAAVREGKYKEADIYDSRATMKLLGCYGAVLLLGILMFFGVVITVVVILAANPTH